MTEVLDPPQLLTQVAVARAAVDALADVPPWQLGERELLAARVAMEELAIVLDAARLGLTGDIDARGAAVSAGASSTRAWLAHACGQHPGAAHAEVRLAAALRDTIPATAAAMARGACSRAAAAIVADTVGEVAGYAPHRVAEAEGFLLAQARALGPKPLAVAARRLAHTLDPDQGDRLARDETHQHEARSLVLSDRRDGTVVLRGLLDREAGVAVRTALEPLARPRPAAHGVPDPRSAPQRTADALTALAEIALAHGDLPETGGQRPHITLTVTAATLTATTGPGVAPGKPHDGPGAEPGVAPGELDRGGPLSAETARRISCDAQLTTVLLGDLGQPLALGRATRQPSIGMLRALAARDHGCAFPGCDRPVAWTQAHHVVHWSRGGATELSNLVLACGHHHRVLHHDGWNVTIDPDGLPTFHPPPWLDPDQPPLRQPRPQLLL